MMKDEDNISWKEIYDYYKVVSWKYPSLRKGLTVEEVHIKYFSEAYKIFGYDCGTNDDVSRRIKHIEASPVSFLLSGDSANKGTLHTIKLLDTYRDNEIQAAIWLYTFTEEVLRYSFSRSSRQKFENVWRESKLFLKDKVEFWHHSMRKFVPELCFSHCAFDECEIKSFRPVVEFALINANFIVQNYRAVLYKTDDKSEGCN